MVVRGTRRRGSWREVRSAGSAVSVGTSLASGHAAYEKLRPFNGWSYFGRVDVEEIAKREVCKASEISRRQAARWARISLGPENYCTV